MTNEIKWTLDPSHSEISFKVRHMMISNTKGSFKIFDANIYTTGKDFTTAQIDLWIDVSSVDTGDTKRDEHLKGDDFFNVKTYKQINFTSSNIEMPDLDGNHTMWGLLTIKGKTQNIELQVQSSGIIHDPWGKERAGFTVTGKINRSDWGLTWNSTTEMGGLMVGEEVNISCELELINAGEKEVIMDQEAAVTF